MKTTTASTVGLVLLAMSLTSVSSSGCVPIPPDGASQPGGGQQAPAEQDPNRTVTVTINGAVIGPADQNGKAWDGPGLAPDDVNLFSGLVLTAFPVGQIPVLGDMVKAFAGDLANTLFATFAPPDAKGTVSNAAQGAEFELSKVQDCYTPEWDVQVPQVPIHGRGLIVVLADADVAFDDPIAQIVIDEQMMLAAEQVGGMVAIDTASTTGGMVQRLFITVTTPGFADDVADQVVDDMLP